jgi:molybdenum-dependent DNA-binding transcriptional regulator ModE
MDRNKNQLSRKERERKPQGMPGADADAVELGQELLSTYDDIQQDIDELLARAKSKDYNLAKKYRQKSGQ